jgi:L-arginine dehydrogenase
LNVLCELCALLFEALVQGQALQPVQTSTDFPGFGGDFFTSLGAIQAARVIGAKLSSFVVTDGAQIVTAKTQFMSMTTGTPLALLYAMHLTTERTACTSALAVELGDPPSAPVWLTLAQS